MKILHMTDSPHVYFAINSVLTQNQLCRDLRIFAWRKFEPRREKLKIGGMIYDLLILEQLFENVDLSSWKKGKGWGSYIMDGPVYGFWTVRPWGLTVLPAKLDSSLGVFWSWRSFSTSSLPSTASLSLSSQVYSGTTDPYLSFLSDSHSLFSTKPTSNGKKSDPLKFSDPLSFGTSDPLSYGVSDPLRSVFFPLQNLDQCASEDLCAVKKGWKSWDASASQLDSASEADWLLASSCSPCQKSSVSDVPPFLPQICSVRHLKGNI